MKREPFNSPEREKEPSVYFTRHSEARYKTFTEILKSKNPARPFSRKEQETPDLTAEGEELAKKRAEEFFNNLDPEKDVLFFASSDQSRALETADIFRQVAKKRGFKIVKPEHVRSELTKKIGEGEIRHVENLSLHINNVLAQAVFLPKEAIEQINWEQVDPEVKKRWERAREIIDKDDKGSWGDNYYRYSDSVKEILPEIESSKEVFDKTFNNLARLIRFANKKIEQADLDKDVKVLAFGHENYLMEALGKYFKKHDIKNCETISFGVDNDAIIVKFRAEETRIKE